MRLNHDPKHNIAYLSLREKDEMVTTLAISSEVNIDVSPDGKIYGIELLNANEQLAGSGEFSFSYVNELLNVRKDLSL